MRFHARLVILLASCIPASAEWSAELSELSPEGLQAVPIDGLIPPPAYMVDNTGNTHGFAPDGSQQRGPEWPQSGSFDGYMAKLGSAPLNNVSLAGDDYWFPALAEQGKVWRYCFILNVNLLTYASRHLWRPITNCSVT